MATLIFCGVYLGMILGNLPGFALDRTGIALLAGISLLLFGHFSSSELIGAIDWTTIAMLFGLMILSAQFYFSGFYYFLIEKIERLEVHPRLFLLIFTFAAGILSAVLINDIICLALAPLSIALCSKKGWNPRPFLLSLAASANIGSVITLIGNPQNILISESMNLSFAGYLYHAAVPGFLGLFWVWVILSYQTRNSWMLQTNQRLSFVEEKGEYDLWQMIKGILILALLLLCFFFSSFARYELVLAAGGVILLSRKMASEKMLGFIDWQLLILFFGLFLTNAAFLHSDNSQKLMQWLGTNGLNFQSPAQLYAASFVLTNVVSNVPAVMLLLPSIQSPMQASILAISSTLAGNLFLIGSLANLIVVSKAKAHGVPIFWKDHLKSGIPIALGTGILSAFWLYLIG